MSVDITVNTAFQKRKEKKKNMYKVKDISTSHIYVWIIFLHVFTCAVKVKAPKQVSNWTEKKI